MALGALSTENKTMAGRNIQLITKRQLPKNGVERILVRGTNWIGDAVLTLPALSALKRTYSGATIFILAKPWVADVYRLCPYVDKVILYQRPGIHDGLTGMLRLARDLKAMNFHMAICLQNAIEAAIITFLARISVRAGYDSDGRGFLLTHAVRRNRDVKRIHQADYYLEMLKALGCEDGEGDPYFKLAPEDDRSAEELLLNYGHRETRLLVGIAPGATYGPAKKWFPERFAALADRLNDELSAQIILFGSAGDEETARAVKKNAKHSFIDLTGKTGLRATISVIAKCSLFISNDSGLMHIAAALNIPTVAIFGSTNPLTTAPLGEKCAIIYKDADCSPCLRETCPTDFHCMGLISSDEVFIAARNILWKG
jgi:heptosyltransferase II